MLEVSHISKTFNAGTVNEKRAISDLSLRLADGEFATIVGSNGAGKSTLFNAIAGVFYVDTGTITLDGRDITFLPSHKRSRRIGHLFQDPLKGTAPHMTIEENLAVAYLRSPEKHKPFRRVTRRDRDFFRDALAQLDMGLEDRMNTPVGLLSGGLIRFYYGTDLIGNEIGAAAKNVVGIAAGMLDGMGVSSLKGALMSRGTREIARLIAAMGGSERSAYGLCHLGDYEATVFSKYSHNRRFGELFVTGQTYSELAEGDATVRALCAMAEKTGVELPICQTVHAVLHEGADAGEAMSRLFMRSLKHEF